MGDSKTIKEYIENWLYKSDEERRIAYNKLEEILTADDIQVSVENEAQFERLLQDIRNRDDVAMIKRSITILDDDVTINSALLDIDDIVEALKGGRQNLFEALLSGFVVKYIVSYDISTGKIGTTLNDSHQKFITDYLSVLLGGVVDDIAHEELFRMNNGDDIEEIYERVKNYIEELFKRTHQQEKDMSISLHNAAIQVGVAPDRTVQLARYQNTKNTVALTMNNTITMTPTNTNLLGQWIDMTEITEEHSPKFIDDLDIQIRDTGLKSLYWTVLVVEPGIFNSILMSSKYEGTNDNDSVNGKDILTIKTKVRDVMNGTLKISNLEFINLISTLFILKAYKMISDNKDILFSSAPFRDTRLHMLDMVLSIIGIGIRFNRTIIGNKNRLIPETIKSSKSLFIVKKPAFKKIKPGLFNEFYINGKVNNARFLHRYDDYGVWGDGDEYHTIEFWKRCERNYIRIATYGNSTILERVVRRKP